MDEKSGSEIGREAIEEAVGNLNHILERWEDITGFETLYLLGKAQIRLAMLGGVIEGTNAAAYLNGLSELVGITMVEAYLQELRKIADSN
jgi:hypothetical protein